MFNETSYGLGDLGAYVHGGARIMYQATVAPLPDPFGMPWETSPSTAACNKLRSVITGNFRDVSFGCDGKNGSINLQATVPGDFSDENDVKGLVDGAVSSAGFAYRQSMLRMISNPGGTSSNPFVPPEAGLEPKPIPNKGWLDVAAEFWAQAASDLAHAAGDNLIPKSPLGIGMSVGTIALIAVGAFILLKR